MRRLDGLRVLVVEDASDVRAVLKRLLEMEGAEVVATGSGREAIKLATEGAFGAVLTYLGLPDVTGDDVVGHVKATSPHRPRVVVATAYGEPYTGRARRQAPTRS